MKLLTKILLTTGGVIMLYKIKNTPSVIGYGSGLNNLTKLWGTRVIYSFIPSAGITEAIFESAKYLQNIKNE